MNIFRAELREYDHDYGWGTCATGYGTTPALAFADLTAKDSDIPGSTLVLRESGERWNNALAAGQIDTDPSDGEMTLDMCDYRLVLTPVIVRTE